MLLEYADITSTSLILEVEQADALRVCSYVRSFYQLSGISLLLWWHFNEDMSIEPRNGLLGFSPSISSSSSSSSSSIDSSHPSGYRNPSVNALRVNELGVAIS
ncbi:hypothetical protein M0802_014373 [Mischocyttarus mexicanus]|nr:hypothetical protein M0802_014373 [Mischocyttarus mexicanus]